MTEKTTQEVECLSHLTAELDTTSDENANEKSRSEWLQIAESNGIDRCTFDSRIYKYKWTHENAATTPARARHKGSLTNDERKVRGYARVMKCQLAIQAQIDDVVNIIKAKREQAKLVKNARKIAMQNGISYAAFNMRISRGWSLEDAAQTIHRVTA